MRKPLAQRQRERAAARAASKRGVSPAPEPVREVVEEQEDAAELEYQEKTTRKKRSYRKKKDQ
jgi:hypothetical protein